MENMIDNIFAPATKWQIIKYYIGQPIKALYLGTLAGTAYATFIFSALYMLSKFMGFTS